MSEELDILRLVADNPAISQRKISEQAGISLGQVNFLIKKCVKKGWIKLEGQTAKSIRYNITPKGLFEKAELTRQYIKASYIAILKISEKMRAVESEYLMDGKEIFVTGDDDELMAVARLALKPESFLEKSGENVVHLSTREFI